MLGEVSSAVVAMGPEQEFIILIVRERFPLYQTEEVAVGIRTLSPGQTRLFGGRGGGLLRLLPGKPPTAGFMVRSLKMPSFHNYETARALLRNNRDVHVLGKDAISGKKNRPSK
jgi:hypothetical protein